MREDGLRLMDGCLPTLIQWGATPLRQPACSGGVQLRSSRCSTRSSHPERGV